MKQQTLTCFLKDSSSKKRKLTHASSTRPVKSVNNASKFSACPLCSKSFPMHTLLTHAGNCNGVADGDPKRQEDLQTSSVAQDRKPSAVVVTPVVQPSTQVAARTATTTDWWKLAQQKQAKIENAIEPSSEPIPGLHLFHEFITEAEEQQIIAQLDDSSSLPWKFAKFNGPHRGKRWGVHCNLRDRKVGAAENPMPSFFREILEKKLKRIEPMRGCAPNEANAIDYRRKNGDYLTDHVDDRQLSKEPIANLSLMGDCFMTFTNQRKQGSGERHRILLPRRTLQVLTGKARYDYSHGIRKEDLLTDRRVSVTMRESPLGDTSS